MLKRMSLVLLLMVAMTAIGGCRFTNRTPVLEDLGGYGPWPTGKTKMLGRTWARDLRHNERLIDNYIFNYDVNDPYRGDYLVGY